MDPINRPSNWSRLAQYKLISSSGTRPIGIAIQDNGRPLATRGSIANIPATAVQHTMPATRLNTVAFAHMWRRSRPRPAMWICANSSPTCPNAITIPSRATG